MPSPPSIPPLIPHVRYGSRPVDPAWLFFGAARQALKFLAQQLMRQQPDTQFVVPAYTCDSVVQALDEAGAPMEFVDIAPNLDLDERELHNCARKLEGRPVALMATPLFGAPIRHYKRGFPDWIVIEDRAQTLPDPERRADFQLLSFGPGKQVSGMGGGALLGAERFATEHRLLPQECGALRYLALSLVGDMLFGPAWSLAGQRVTQRHSAQAVDKESRNIEVQSLCSGRAQWIFHSLQTWEGTVRTSTSDAYQRSIPGELQFDIPSGHAYLRFPVRAKIDGPGVSSGRMYEKVVQRAEKSSGRRFPGARALMDASFLPTHHRVTRQHIDWYLQRLSGLAGPGIS